MYNRILLIHIKECNLAICNNIDGSRAYYTSGISQTGKDKYLIISLTCGICKNKRKNIKTVTDFTDVENKLVVARGAADKTGEGNSALQMSSYKINKSLRCDVQLKEYS